MGQQSFFFFQERQYPFLFTEKDSDWITAVTTFKWNKRKEMKFSESAKTSVTSFGTGQQYQAQRLDYWKSYLPFTILNFYNE